MMNKFLLGDDAVSIGVNLLQNVVNNVVHLLILHLSVEHFDECDHNSVDLVIINRPSTI